MSPLPASDHDHDASRTLVRLKTRDDGRLALLFLTRSQDGLRTGWISLTTTGRRDIEIARSEVLHDGSVDPDEQTIAIALAWRAEPPTAESIRDVAAFRAETGREAGRMVRTAGWDHPAVARFALACGASTMKVAFFGWSRFAPLLALDAACGRAAVEAFFARWPFLLGGLVWHAADGAERTAEVAGLLGCEDEKTLAPALVGLTARRAAEREALAGPAALFLKRLRGVDCVKPIMLESVLELAAAVPADWLPREAGELEAFQRAAAVLRELNHVSDGALPLGALASSAKGRWREFVDRLGASGSATQAASDVRDMVSAFVGQVLHPAILHGMTFGAGPARPDAGLRRAVAAEAAGSPAEIGPALERHAFALLLGGKAAPAVLEASARWHRRREAMERVMAGEAGITSWPVPFSRLEGGGYALIAISDSFALSHEGAALRHCVGGYAGRCLSRASVIVSVRRIGADGEETRSSTLELSAWAPGRPWRPTVLQHRGVHNSLPSTDDVAAVAAALANWTAENRPADGEAEDETVAPKAVDGPHGADGLAHGGYIAHGGGGGGGGGVMHVHIGGPHGVVGPHGGGGGGGGPAGWLPMPVDRWDPEDDDVLPGDRRRYEIVRRYAGQTADDDLVSMAAGYDWMDRGAVDVAFGQWAPFLPAAVAEAGPQGFLDGLDGIVGADAAAAMRAAFGDGRMLRKRPPPKPSAVAVGRPRLADRLFRRSWTVTILALMAENVAALAVIGWTGTVPLGIGFLPLCATVAAATVVLLRPRDGRLA